MVREEVLKEKCMDAIDVIENKNDECNYFKTICAIKKDRLQNKMSEENGKINFLDHDYCTMFMTF